MRAIDRKAYDGGRRPVLYWYRVTGEPMKLTAVFREVAEGYIGFIEELPGANVQGATLDEARSNLDEAVSMVLAANRMLAQASIEGQRVIREPFILTES
jgi:predicted RNase H-like HicB family nuclease